MVCYRAIGQGGSLSKKKGKEGNRRSTPLENHVLRKKNLLCPPLPSGRERERERERESNEDKIS